MNSLLQFIVSAAIARAEVAVEKAATDHAELRGDAAIPPGVGEAAGKG